MKQKLLFLIILIATQYLMAQNYSVEFDGNDDYITCGNSSTLRPSSAITVEAWVYINSIGSWEAIISNLQDNSSTESGCGLYFNGGNITWWLTTVNASSNIQDDVPNSSISTHTWTHIAGTYDGSFLRLYINGIHINDDYAMTGEIDWNNTPLNFYIGAYIDDNEDYYFDGLIDEVRVWNYARTQNEIASTMRNELNGNETGLLGYWQLNENTGTSTQDETSNNNDGTLTNGPTWSYTVPAIAQFEYLDYKTAPISISSAVSTSNFTEYSDGFAMKFYSGGFSSTEYYAVACNQNSGTSTLNLTGDVDRKSLQFWRLMDNSNDYITVKIDLDQFCPDLYNSELEADDYKLLYDNSEYWNVAASGASINGHVITFNNVLPTETFYTIGRDNDEATVSTSSISNVAVTSATCGGNVTADGGGTVTAKGVCWNTAGSPTVSNSKTTDGSGTGSYTSSITGLDPNTTYYVRAYATNSEGTTYGTQLSFTTTNTLTWDGSAGSSWTIAANWDGNISPPSTVNIVIPTTATDPLIASDETVICNNLTINSGGEMTVAAGGNITISGNLSNSGTFTVASDNSNTGSVIVESTASGNINFERYVTSGKWHYVSAPVDAISLAAWMPLNNIAQYESQYQFYRWDEDTQYWIHYGYTGEEPEDFGDTQFVDARGYTLTTTADGELSFTGAPLTSNVVYNASYSPDAGAGFHLVGNPFSSDIAITSLADATNNFLADNTDLLDASYQAIYIWNEGDLYTYGNNDYSVICNTGFSGEGSGSKIGKEFVQPGQAFMIKVKEEGEIYFNADIRKHGDAAFYKNEGEWPGLELTITGNSTHNSTIVAFNSQMSKGLDPSYDVAKLKGNHTLSVYTLLIEDNGSKFAIQALNNQNHEDYIIPVGVEIAEPGNYTFSVYQEYMESYNILLEDRQQNTMTNLCWENYTTLISESGTGRFFLHFKDATAIGENPDNSNILIWSAYRQIYIKGSDAGKVTVLDVMGRVILQKEISDNESISVPVNLQSGIYLVTVQNGKEIKTGKVFIK
jgi:hypothetical protein